MKKRILCGLIGTAMVMSLLVGCTSKKEEAASGETAKTEEVSKAKEEKPKEDTKTETAADTTTGTGSKFNYTPVENKDGKEIRIATLLVQNNPFWVTVAEGANDATTILKDKKYNCTVDMISFDDFDGQEFSEAINTCVVKGYDAICTVGVADSIVPAIDAATAAGIPVYTFNSETAKESKRVAFVGQDLHAAGVLLGETLADMIGKNGKVGIITGMYSVNAHELRRQGIEEGLAKSTDITVVGSVENHDSGDEAYTATKNFITANPDLKGIAVTAGGPHGAAKAIEELGLTDQITLVCFDTTDEIVSYMKKGVIKASIGQDPYGQGADPIILAYNQIINNKAEVTGNAFTKMDIFTPENISEYFPD